MAGAGSIFIDLDKVASETEFEAEVAVIGAGAAGIALARRLLRRGRRVLLLESGGLDLEPAAQSLNQGRLLGLPYYPLTESRARTFGGTTATWSGRNIPLDPIDFRQRPWVPHSGWPIGYEALLPFYREAQAVTGVGEFRYDDLWRDVGLDDPGLDPALFAVRFWRIRIAHLGREYRAEMARDPRLRVLLRGTATALLPAPDGGAVRAVRVATLGGRRFTLRAQQVVLATGGIENARLLLASDPRAAEGGRGGLGNGRDLVGRFFMEHPKCRTATLRAAEPYRLLEAWRKHHPRGGPQLWPSIVATESVQRRHGILNASLALYFRTLPGVTEAASRIDAAMKRRCWPSPRDLAALLPVLGELPANLVRRYWRGRAPIARPTGLYVLVRGEQAPNPDSRVLLSPERDALGQRRADLDWRLSPLDKRSAAVMTELLAGEFRRLGLGEVRPDPWLAEAGDGWPLHGEDHHAILQGGHHHIGTTRMATHPGAGVVDADCRVFGLGNLFVAGSSVFPTSGWANPTLTIVALALRLGDHLADRLDAARAPALATDAA